MNKPLFKSNALKNFINKTISPNFAKYTLYGKTFSGLTLFLLPIFEDELSVISSFNFFDFPFIIVLI